MATMIQRQPFGELGTARLQSLISAKNCQNATTEMLLSPDTKGGKPSMTTLKQSSTFHLTTNKRSYEPTIFEDDSDLDTENVDPSIFSPKRSKCNDGKANAYATFTSLNNPTPSSSSTLKRKSTTPPPPSNAYSPFPNASLTAPAGRSPRSKQHKRINLLSSKHNRTLYKSIHPPSSGTSTAPTTTPFLPFSLDEAIRGTLSPKQPTTTPPTAAREERPAQKPKSWFFTIYEDTPDEEAATLMEHSTLCLDLSASDDDRTSIDNRGKENIPPPGHVPTHPLLSGNQSQRAEASLVGVASAEAKPKPAAALGATRRKTLSVDAMKDADADADAPRSPLGEMAPEEFYGEGLHASSVEIVGAEVEGGSVVGGNGKVPVVGGPPHTVKPGGGKGGKVHIAVQHEEVDEGGCGFVIAEDPVECS